MPRTRPPRYHSRVSRRARYEILLLLVLNPLAACRDTPAAFGPSPALARANADDLFLALQRRFTRPERPPALSAALRQIVQSAFTPSQLYDDSTLWNTRLPDGERALITDGTYATDHYAFTTTSSTTPERLGDAHHEIRLQRLGPSVFEWNTSVTTAIGLAHPADLDRVLSALLGECAREDVEALRTGSHATFPHTSVVLGQLLTVDSLERTPLADGSAQITLGVTMQPAGIAATYPHFASYLEHYVARIRVHADIVDTDGTTWLTFRSANGRYLLTVRATADGHLAPLSGPPRTIPDSLLVHGELFTKVSLFTVGMSDLVAQLVLIHGAHDRAWALHFRDEPRWQFPLAVDRLMKSPLRRPFADGGALVRVGLADSTSGEAHLTRDSRLDIQESAIVRWLGGLAGNAIGAFTGSVESEGDAFFAETFAALRDDVGR